MMVTQTEESCGHARMIETLLKQLNDQEQHIHENSGSGVCNNPLNGHLVALRMEIQITSSSTSNPYMEDSASNIHPFLKALLTHS